MEEKIMIEVKQLEKVFTSKNSKVKALENINLQIMQGEVFGIIGLSGAGKSTLVRCMNFLERPTSGEVMFDGKKLSTLSNKELRHSRQSMGMIFQQFHLLMQKNALDNVCFPLEIAGMKKKEARKHAEELLEMVGLSDRAKSYPSQLSGGQKQRVAIARALATNPKVLLCDEATSALDPTTTKSILELLKEINQKLGITIVIITHEMEVIEKVCHRVAIIDQSQIAECGTVTEVFQRPKSKIAKRLVFSEETATTLHESTCNYSIIFDGQSSYEPVVANMVLECKAPVNILFADTKNVEGKAIGRMILQFPAEEQVRKRMLSYLDYANIKYEEVEQDAW